MEYAAPHTHLVLIARDLRRLHEVAARVQSKGATVAVHSLDLFDPASQAKLQHLLQEVDTTAGCIDVAISCASVTGHRSDVLGLSLAHIPPVAAADADAPQGSEYWGATTASRMLQVNVAACQEFILRSWELMKARRLQLQGGRPKPKIIVLSSSTAFYTPATFALYAAAKAYLYSLTRSLQVASAPYGIGVVAVTPGFMETGLTENMIRSGATCPRAILGDPRKLARKIKRSEERDELLIVYPVTQVWALFSARALNPLLETLALWVGATTGVASWFFS
jgi:short-subunit dehydrogenase